MPSSKAFVGRERELAQLGETLSRAVEGEGRLVLIGGEAGIGKTRLVNTLIEEKARKAGVDCRVGRCIYQQGSDPYLPFLDALAEVEGGGEQGAVPKQLLSIGQRYLLLGASKDEAYHAFHELLAGSGKRGLCLTTTKPETIKRQYKLKGAGFLWMAYTGTDEDRVDPTRLEFEVKRRLGRFFEEEAGGIFMLDGIEFLLMENDASKVFDFIKTTLDLAAMKGSTVLLPVDPQATGDAFVAVLEPYLTVIDQWGGVDSGGARGDGGESLRRGDFTTSRAYMVEDIDFYPTLSSFAKGGRPCLVFTSRFPGSLVERYRLDPGGVYWFTDMTSKEHNVLSPNRIEFEVTREIRNFSRENKRPLVFIDNVGYLIRKNGFDAVYRFLKNASDMMTEEKGTFVIWCGTKALESKELRTLERIFTPLGKALDEKHVESSKDLIREKNRIYEGFLASVTSLSQRAPLLLFLDDLQWADRSSLRLLHYIARNTQRERVFICGTYRIEDIEGFEETHPFKDTMRLMSRERLYDEIVLSRLSERDISEIVDGMFLKADLPPSFKGRIFKETEGNPFYVEEVLQSLVQKGVLYEDGGVWRCGDLESMEIPGSIVDIISRRLETLDDESLDVLRLAAFLGKEFDFDVLAGISEMKEDEVIDILDLLVESRILEYLDEDGERYGFTQNKIREVIYNGVRGPRKRKLHLSIGEALERAYKGRTDSVLFDLAYHFSRTKSYSKAAEYLEKAGDRMYQSFDPEEAARYYAEALASLQKSDVTEGRDALMLSLWNKLARSHYILGKFDEAIEAAEEAADLAEGMGDREQTADAYKYIGDIELASSNWDAALENYSTALRFSKETGDSVRIAEAYRGIGRAYWRKGEHDNAMEALKKSLQRAELIEDVHTMAKVYIDIGNVSQYKGDYERAMECFKLSLDMLENIGDKYELARAYNNIGGAYAWMGKFKESIAWFEKCIELSEKIGWEMQQGYGYSNAAEMYIETGELDRALEYCQRGIEIFRRQDEASMIGYTEMVYGIILGKKGDYPEATRHFDLAHEKLVEIDHKDLMAQNHLNFGLMLRSQGDGSKALEELKKALELWKRLGNEKRVESVKEIVSEINNS